VKKIKKSCSKIGLYPIEISKVDVYFVVEYLNDIQVDLLTSNPIPLGFDYTCEN